MHDGRCGMYKHFHSSGLMRLRSVSHTFIDSFKLDAKKTSCFSRRTAVRMTRIVEAESLELISSSAKNYSSKERSEAGEWLL